MEAELLGVERRRAALPCVQGDVARDVEPRRQRRLWELDNEVLPAIGTNLVQNRISTGKLKTPELIIFEEHHLIWLKVFRYISQHMPKKSKLTDDTEL